MVSNEKKKKKNKEKIISFLNKQLSFWVWLLTTPLENTAEPLNYIRDFHIYEDIFFISLCNNSYYLWGIYQVLCSHELNIIITILW